MLHNLLGVLTVMGIKLQECSEVQKHKESRGSLSFLGSQIRFPEKCLRNCLADSEPSKPLQNLKYLQRSSIPSNPELLALTSNNLKWLWGTSSDSLTISKFMPFVLGNIKSVRRLNFSSGSHYVS